MAQSSERIDAITLLKGDHRTVEDLFEKFEAARGKPQKQKIAEKICLELCVHAMIEEEIFYPALKGKIEDDMLSEAYVEHDGAKMLIAEILQGGPDDEFYEAKVKVLSEEIKHHVKEEEQRDGMFAQAKAAGIDMEELGAELATRKEELLAEYETNGVPPPLTRSLSGAKVEYGQPEA
jgi:hemerythrin superfamily protein